MKTQLWAVLFSFVGTLIGAFGPIYLKRGSGMLNRESLHTFKQFIRSTIGNRALLIGITCYALGFIIYTISLSGADVSVLYPLGSVAYIWVTILSKIILGEHITRLKIAGVICIIAGAALVGLGS